MLEIDEAQRFCWKDVSEFLEKIEKKPDAEGISEVDFLTKVIIENKKHLNDYLFMDILLIVNFSEEEKTVGSQEEISKIQLKHLFKLQQTEIKQFMISFKMYDSKLFRIKVYEICPLYLSEIILNHVYYELLFGLSQFTLASIEDIKKRINIMIEKNINSKAMKFIWTSPIIRQRTFAIRTGKALTIILRNNTIMTSQMK